MHSSRLRLMLILALCALTLAPGRPAWAAPPDAATAARLRTIQQACAHAESLIHNVRGIARMTDWRRKGTDEQDFPGDHKGWTTRQQWTTFSWDNQGRAMIEDDYHYHSAPLRTTLDPVKIVRTWNGTEERDTLNGGPIIISEKNTAFAARKASDFAMVGKETVSAFLGRALEGGWPIRLTEDSATSWTLTVEAPEPAGATEYRLTLDPTRGFYLGSGERRRGGILLERWHSTPQPCYVKKDQVAPGAWFPGQGLWQTFIEEKGQSVLDTEWTLRVRPQVWVNDDYPYKPAHYTLRTDSEMIADELERPLPGLTRNIYLGRNSYPDFTEVKVRFDLPAADFARFFDGTGHLPAARDFQLDHTQPNVFNGSLRDFFFDHPWHKDDSGGFTFPWWRVRELADPLFAWKEEVRKHEDPRHYTRVRYLFAAGKEDRGYRRVYCLFIWTFY